MQQIADWLEKAQSRAIRSALAENDIDLDILSDLTDPLAARNDSQSGSAARQ